MEDVENKVDQLLEMYMKDREKTNWLTHPARDQDILSNNLSNQSISNHKSSNYTTKSPISKSYPSNNQASYIIAKYSKPKPFLVEDASLIEPDSFKPAIKCASRPIQRINSDIGSRLTKKKISLRHSLDTSTPSTRPGWNASSRFNTVFKLSKRNSRQGFTIGSQAISLSSFASLKTESQEIKEANNEINQDPVSSFSLLCDQRDESKFDETKNEVSIPMGFDSRNLHNIVSNKEAEEKSDNEILKGISTEPKESNNELSCESNLDTVIYSETETVLNFSAQVPRVYQHHPHHHHHLPHRRHQMYSKQTYKKDA